MLSLSSLPDYAQLEAAAESLQDNEASSLAPNRRQDPRRPVSGPIHAGIVPGPCERLTLGRIPVSVFKPVWGGWAVDLSLSGLALVTDRRVPQAQRWWLRLDGFATRPTLLPAFAAGCRPLDSHLQPEPDAGADGEPAPTALFRVRFKFQVAQQSLVERLQLEASDPTGGEEELRLLEAAAA